MWSGPTSVETSSIIIEQVEKVPDHLVVIVVEANIPASTFMHNVVRIGMFVEIVAVLTNVVF